MKNKKDQINEVLLFFSGCDCSSEPMDSQFDDYSQSSERDCRMDLEIDKILADLDEIRFRLLRIKERYDGS